MAIGFTVPLDPFGFWNVVIIALSLPVVAGSLVIKWKGSGKKSMAKGAMMILVIGGIVMVGVTIWFISVLNSLGNQRTNQPVEGALIGILSANTMLSSQNL